MMQSSFVVWCHLAVVAVVVTLAVVTVMVVVVMVGRSQPPFQFFRNTTSFERYLMCCTWLCSAAVVASLTLHILALMKVCAMKNNKNERTSPIIVPKLWISISR